MNSLPKEAFAELTGLTIQRQARWMEYKKDMEDFGLAAKADAALAEQATIYLCGYIPQLALELCILACTEQDKGIFYSLHRGGDAELVMQEFALSDYQNDFEPNMLMYAATMQIMMRGKDEAYHNLAAELAASKSSCSGCSGCSH